MVTRMGAAAFGICNLNLWRTVQICHGKVLRYMSAIHKATSEVWFAVIHEIFAHRLGRYGCLFIKVMEQTSLGWKRKLGGTDTPRV